MFNNKFPIIVSTPFAGESGVGLVLNQTLNDHVKWYLRGIVSPVANKMGSCDDDKYSA